MTARLSPLPPDHNPELREHFEKIEGLLGYVPNSILTMQRLPALVRALAAMGMAVNSPHGKIDPGLKSCVGEIASKISGCVYCQAHFVTHGEVHGVTSSKLRAVWEYRTSDLFNDAEKAALDFAVAAAQSPNAVTDEHFAALRTHFDEDQIVELTAQLCYVAFLNRWNDTMATSLESEAVHAAHRTYGSLGWQAGKHK